MRPAYPDMLRDIVIYDLHGLSMQFQVWGELTIMVLVVLLDHCLEVLRTARKTQAMQRSLLAHQSSARQVKVVSRHTHLAWECLDRTA